MTEPSIKDRIETKLRTRFTPERLIVTDDSHRHAGHAGARPGGQTHFAVEIVSDSFRAQSRVDIHRAIHALLAEEFAAGVHALAISARAP